MPKIYNKIINSPTPPKNTSDIWECNGKFYLYKGGGWEALKTDSESQADWNAQEGEPGYITNKPFYTEGDIRQIDVNGEYSIAIGEFNIGDRIDISWDLVYYNDEIFRGSTSFVIQEGEEPTQYYEGDNFYIWGGKTFEMYAYGASDSLYGKVTVMVNGEIKTLEEKYIPNTIIKTTPQILSETDKNQVLANLGIDNTKYTLLGTPDNGFNIQEFINKFGFIPELKDNGYGGYIGDLVITNKELFIDAVLCCDFENGVSKCIYINNNTVSFMFMGYITNGHIVVSYAENDIKAENIGC